MERIATRQIKSGDAQIFYRVLGEGPPVVLLHPFPANHELWLPAAEALAPRYRLILPDLRGHPDLVDGALRMMRKMSPEDVVQVQRGMAERPDSVPTLKTINVPTLIVTGEEDILTGVNEAQAMHRHISGSNLRLVAKAGHYSPWERPEEVTTLLRQFLDSSR
ncbi:MAG: alpha/beta fold hydrolase [Candidatus Sulfotelmatobacter sp.]